MEDKFLPLSQVQYTKQQLKDTQILVLSFVGDAVHTLYVRTKLVQQNPYDNNELHKLTSKEICAENQAKFVSIIEPMLDEDELFILKKGKNAKVNTVPKHAKLYDYKLATAFEALVGYLYLLGNNERLNQIFEIIYKGEDKC